jgi:hypothetical protein
MLSCADDDRAEGARRATPAMGTPLFKPRAAPAKLQDAIEQIEQAIKQYESEMKR